MGQKKTVWTQPLHHVSELTVNDTACLLYIVVICIQTLVCFHLFLSVWPWSFYKISINTAILHWGPQADVINPTIFKYVWIKVFLVVFLDYSFDFLFIPLSFSFRERTNVRTCHIFQLLQVLPVEFIPPQWRWRIPHPLI